jgi:hypothetical protein
VIITGIPLASRQIVVVFHQKNVKQTRALRKKQKALPFALELLDEVLLQGKLSK